MILIPLFFSLLFVCLKLPAMFTLLWVALTRMVRHLILRQLVPVPHHANMDTSMAMSHTNNIFINL